MKTPEHPWGYDVRGSATATFTPVADKQRVKLIATVCDQRVTPAPNAVIGRCTYYYKPLHKEYVAKTGVATWQAVKAWVETWNPWSKTEKDVVERLLKKRSELIQPESASPDWSRHANFMMRHIGCGHQPPDYYVSYGYYYCSRYGKLLNPKLTTRGQDWLKAAREGLQKNMDSGLKQNMDGNAIFIPCKRYPNRSVQMTFAQYKLEINKAAFKVFAFKTHVPAYLDAGLADLPISDLIEIGGEPNIEEWLDKGTWEQAIDSGVEVGQEKIKSAWQDIRQVSGQAAAQALQKLIQQL